MWSSVKEYVRFCPHTYAGTQQSLPQLMGCNKDDKKVIVFKAVFGLFKLKMLFVPCMIIKNVTAGIFPYAISLAFHYQWL